MAGTIIFEQDKDNGIVIAKPVWHIKNIEDCDIWYNQWVDYLSPFNRNVDVVIVLDDFVVDAAIASEWAMYRAMINTNYTRFSYRVNANLLIEAFTRTSGAIYHAPADEAGSIELAYEAIIADRKKMGIV
jgi:hypothetical protein